MVMRDKHVNWACFEVSNTFIYLIRTSCSLNFVSVQNKGNLVHWYTDVCMLNKSIECQNLNRHFSYLPVIMNTMLYKAQYTVKKKNNIGQYYQVICL